MSAITANLSGPYSGAAPAARFAVAPMMDWTDFSKRITKSAA
ncbi:hypothetical protein [Afifella sp. IM 167]|nr:hypothetical protein [Afifella sp. IM 167]